jgi:hypothetical protein
LHGFAGTVLFFQPTDGTRRVEKFIFVPTGMWKQPTGIFYGTVAKSYHF